ncbi:MAG: hypothetical protein R3B72_03985 [Polyangiaceae bacterium]
MQALSQDEAIRQAMRENMLDEAYRSYVDAFLRRDDDLWRSCCDSGCDPCSAQIARVVDRVRQLMRA